MTYEKFTFFTSRTLIPKTEHRDTTIWPIKYVVVMEDTLVQKLCDFYYSAKTDKDVIFSLIELVKTSQYAWNANVFLYAITQSNAIELSIYAPNKYELWEKERKKKDIELWENYLKNM